PDGTLRVDRLVSESHLLVEVRQRLTPCSDLKAVGRFWAYVPAAVDVQITGLHLGQILSQRFPLHACRVYFGHQIILSSSEIAICSLFTSMTSAWTTMRRSLCSMVSENELIPTTPGVVMMRRF